MARDSAVSFRFTEVELRQLEGLGQLLRRSRSDVVRGAISAFRNLTVQAYAEGAVTHEELQRRYPGELVVISLVEGPSREPLVALRIGSDEPEDVQAFAVIPPGGDHALIFLEVVDRNDPAATRAALERKLWLLEHTNVAFGLHVGTLPWPPQRGQGIVTRIDEIKSGLPPETRELLEPVEA